jgi:hypothetical protein
MLSSQGLLDLNFVYLLDIVFANMLGEVEILLALDSSSRQRFDGLDTVQLFEALSANVP